MPAGDLVVSDGQLELRTTLMGTGTDYVIDRDAGGVSGLLAVVVKQTETEYAHADGSFVGDAFEASRDLTVALLLDGFAAVETMRTVWAPSSTNLELWFQLPDIGKRYVVGRPVGFVPDLALGFMGSIPALASFRITDPTIYTP
jgi:hypothetical protein